MFKVLIIEDNTLFRKTLKEILSREFPVMAVKEAVDGKGGQQKADTFCPDLIFIDIDLHGENGLELTRRIKADHADMIIAILTDYDLPEYRRVAREYGADYFLSKDSTSEEEILAVVASVSERARNGGLTVS